MEVSKSKLLNKPLLWLFVLVSLRPSLGQAAPRPKFPSGGVVLSPLRRLPTDSDRVIRDFVHLLHPEWDNSAWDLVITGKRSMNPNFGVDSWSFAVLDAKQYVLNGFPSSATPCKDESQCFGYPDVAGAKLSGRIYQRGTRIYGFVGARPEIAKQNSDFQKDVGELSPAQVEGRLSTLGAHYAPSQQLELRNFLAARPLFVQYALRTDSLNFCYHAGPSDRTIAMYWSVQVFSTKFRTRYLLTVEPFEGEMTGLRVIGGRTSEGGASCGP